MISMERIEELSQPSIRPNHSCPRPRALASINLFVEFTKLRLNSHKVGQPF